ncbi:unnamed protein product [Didymodactylos carnosus]|uniref:Kinesin light chain n=1 Tax=Didymodactylos carnosus TaxID=1234261 RepID=A0A8S2D717_9BILA|nr:unnamed protein product [Didymodactylos carnosus]CAF3612574.1 unnamed protein product [Didymodactylos carnosus]
MLNKALRVQDTDILFKFRFFVKDLHDQLTTLHSESNDATSTLTVYRGQCMVREEFLEMKANIGGFLSMNSFLSTSTSRAVSVKFAEQCLNRDGVVSVLFEMDIHVLKCIKPFSNIAHLSYIKTENEILFSIGTVFRIESVERHHDRNIWNVKLTMTGEEDEELKKLTEQLRNEITGNSKLNSLGLLLRQMGDYTKAEQYYIMLLNETSANDPSIPTFYNNLGLVYRDMGDYSKALSYYEKTLELRLKTLGSNHPDVATTYNNLGLAYSDMGDYSKALSYYEKTLELDLKTLGSNHPSVATTYNNLGLAYSDMGDYSKALSYYEKTLELQLKTLGSNHPSVATTYSNLGNVYSVMSDYSKALSYYEEALGVMRKSLPATHPSISVCERAAADMSEKLMRHS